jgi:MraZ protein
MVAVVESGEKWGIIMLMGEFHHNIDDKGRLTLPAKFREELGDSFIITRGLESCLFVYTMDEWKKITEKLNNLPFTRKDARSFMRFFLSGATAVEFDKQGRINITSPLVTYADLKKECVIIGVGDRLEIWSSEKWDNFYDTNKDSLSDIAETLFDSNWTKEE